MTSSLRDNFCSSPWFHIRINPNGDYLPCRWDYSSLESSYNIKNINIAEYMNSDAMRNLRLSLLNGQETPNCASCRNEEKYGKVNGRQRQLLKSAINVQNFDKSLCASPHWDRFEYSYNNQGYTNSMPVDLQIDLGDVCNSSCIMCVPRYSTRLASDYIKLHKIEPDLFKVDAPREVWTNDPTLVTKFIDEITAIQNIKYIHFLGGETLYLRSFYDICQTLADKGIAKDIIIGTTTNCTVYTPELEKVLAAFKHTHLGLSVESFHEINDYIRWPSKVSIVKENISKFIKLRDTTDIQLSLRITPSNLSIYHIDTLFEFMLDNNIIAESCNLLVEPSYLRIELLPKDILDAVIAKINKVIKKYNIVDPDGLLINRRDENLKHQVISKIIIEYRNILQNLQLPNNAEEERYKLVKFLQAFESIRNNNILNYLPEYEEFLRSYGY